MLKKCNRFLNIVIGSFLGVLTGRCIYAYWNYRAHPELYAAASALWYTGILLSGLAVSVVVIVCVALKLIIRKKLRE